LSPVSQRTPQNRHIAIEIVARSFSLHHRFIHNALEHLPLQPAVEGREHQDDWALHSVPGKFFLDLAKVDLAKLMEGGDNSGLIKIRNRWAPS
jgi:hypothetical protein